MVNPNPNFWNGRRVLLTGHTGFKGAWLLLWLQELGAQVWGTALAPAPEASLFRNLTLVRPPGDQYSWRHHEGDLADLEDLAEVVKQCQPEVVLHLAAQPLVRRSYRDPLGTWATNVQGSLHLLEALRPLSHACAVVMVTTDKVYANREWTHGYRESDRLGGHDPYSASKAAAELAIASWRASFCGSSMHQSPHLAIATARAGNVIGGGDWAEERIVPDVIRALVADQPIHVRRPRSTRPWQHVLEPLSGYLLLAERLAEGQHSSSHLNAYAEAFNFGPQLEANRNVSALVEEALKHWGGNWLDLSDPEDLHESGQLHLQIDKAYHLLGWQPRWTFEKAVQRTLGWYLGVHEGLCSIDCCLADLYCYQQESCKKTTL
jgi:CDP-glucose 4,6-dehydratase